MRHETSGGITRGAELTAEERLQLERLAALPDEAIDATDIPETSAEQRRTAVRGRSLELARRLDRDLVDWFQARGDDYTAETNRALREYMERTKAVEAGVASQGV